MFAGLGAMFKDASNFRDAEPVWFRLVRVRERSDLRDFAPASGVRGVLTAC